MSDFLTLLPSRPIPSDAEMDATAAELKRRGYGRSTVARSTSTAAGRSTSTAAGRSTATARGMPLSRERKIEEARAARNRGQLRLADLLLKSAGVTLDK